MVGKKQLLDLTQFGESDKIPISFTPLRSSAINTYSVRIVDTDGTFCEITTQAVNPTVAVAETLALVNEASILPWDVTEVTCRVVPSNTSRGISVGKNKPTPVATPVG